MLHERSSLWCRWLLALLLVPAAAGSQQIPAETDLFHVEVLVFAYNTAPDRYYRFPGTPAVQAAVDIAELVAEQGQAAATGSDTVLWAEPTLLAGSLNVLRRLDRYQPLVHSSWKQSAEVFGSSPTVRVHGGSVLEPGPSSVDLLGTEQERRGIEQVDGIVTLERGRFIHLAVDMVYRRPQPAEPRALVTTDAAHFDLDRPYQTHRIAEKRQIQLGEIQYFDHVQFGMLAVVERIQPAGRD